MIGADQLSATEVTVRTTESLFGASVTIETVN